MKFNEIQGDLFRADTSLAHCISRDLKLGAGIALQFRNRELVNFEELKDQNKQVGQVALNIMSLSLIDDDDKYVFHLITKDKYYYKPTYESMKSCLKELRDKLISLNIKEISMPRIGCGLDKMEWHIVKNMIMTIFKETDIEIDIYYL